ncbi:MAG: hypothetical protein GTN53_23005 [Candidatus Aminicenantes bacterium]|nr:hypothetical protein [Candidatus Aminicenantes bacterium]NIQ69373.1 hypothetical protein [Candidatus Aminicenantes bacterium]NIT25374.1 hypothetical protein [Candidatus Aminicenantes bacterium]
MKVARLIKLLKACNPEDQVAVGTWNADGGGAWFLQENASGVLRYIKGEHEEARAVVMIAHYDICKAHDAYPTIKGAKVVKIII